MVCSLLELNRQPGVAPKSAAMFGVAPIRTRAEQMELAHTGLPPRSYNETGAESALLRTRSLLASTAKQQKYILSNLRLASDVRTDELAALSVLK